MDADQFKLVIDTIKTLSGDASSVAIWWIIIDKLVPVIAWLIVGFGIHKIALSLVKNLNSHSDMCSIRDALGIGCSGHLSDGERTRVLREIRRLIELKNKQS